MTWALEIMGHSGLKDWVEVEAVERLGGRQARLGEMALDAAVAALGDLVFGEGREESRGGPTLPILGEGVGTFGEARPDVLDGGQPQVAEQEAEAGGVDRVGRGHAVAPAVAVSAS